MIQFKKNVPYTIELTEEEAIPVVIQFAKDYPYMLQEIAERTKNKDLNFYKCTFGSECYHHPSYEQRDQGSPKGEPCRHNFDCHYDEIDSGRPWRRS